MYKELVDCILDKDPIDVKNQFEETIDDLIQLKLQSYKKGLTAELFGGFDEYMVQGMDEGVKDIITHLDKGKFKQRKKAQHITVFGNRIKQGQVHQIDPEVKAKRQGDTLKRKLRLSRPINKIAKQIKTFGLAK